MKLFDSSLKKVMPKLVTLDTNVKIRKYIKCKAVLWFGGAPSESMNFRSFFFYYQINSIIKK